MSEGLDSATDRIIYSLITHLRVEMDYTRAFNLFFFFDMACQIQNRNACKYVSQLDGCVLSTC